MKIKKNIKKKTKKSYLKKNNQIADFLEESSILGNTLFMGFILFSTILITLTIFNYIFKISSSSWIGIIAFFISTIISILYYTCQRRKKCKIRMIVDLKN